MYIVDTNTVILKKKKYPLKCVCMYRRNDPNGEFLSHFLQVSNSCSTDQLTVEVIRNCNMPFFAENCYLQELYFDIL